jgi:hypothetical protein
MIAFVSGEYLAPKRDFTATGLILYFKSICFCSKSIKTNENSSLVRFKTLKQNYKILKLNCSKPCFSKARCKCIFELLFFKCSLNLFHILAELPIYIFPVILYLNA